MIANNEDIETLAWPSFVKNLTVTANAILGGNPRKNSEGTEERVKDPNNNKVSLCDMLLGGTERLVDASLFHFAMEIRNRAMQSTDLWPLPEKLYHDSRSILKISVPRPNLSLPAPLHLYGVIDPLSPQAQGLIPIFEILNKVLNVELHIVMNPAMKLKEYPLMRWYRQVRVIR